MRACGMPPDLRALGYEPADVPALVAGTLPQQRLLANAPIPIDGAVLTRLFAGALAA
jgi:alcohol dehydrogenase class IV